MRIPATVLTLCFVLLFARSVSASRIAVTGKAVAYVEPEYVTVQVTISTLSGRAADAVERMKDTHDRVLSALKDLDVMSVYTKGSRVEPKYKQDERRRNTEFLGYQANLHLVVRMKSVEMVTEVMDAAVKAGAKKVSSVEFHAEVPDSLQNAVYAAAMSQARSRAEAMAAAAGGQLGKLVDVTTQEAVRATRDDSRGDILVITVSGERFPGARKMSVIVLTKWQVVQDAGE